MRHIRQRRRFPSMPVSRLHERFAPKDNIAFFREITDRREKKCTALQGKKESLYLTMTQRANSGKRADKNSPAEQIPAGCGVSIEQFLFEML
ncbi:MAG: hypothetical protein MSH25_00415 [Desulfovibrio sp.]|uniref:hypothetical protein n=1 Tax=Desulfovibrio sp. TaxID=885 RepID=UPI0025C6CCF0|nr:hypothetical protein [Desulfovibrio sp.]MCI7567831.1 hypothetical protein [Desulfovibrio sp.]